MKIAKLLRHFRIDDPKRFRLADIDPADCRGLDIEKDEAKDMLKEGVARLSKLQEMLYAQDRRSVLAIFQAMDAAGKDSAIKHVMSGINPQGCQVFSFKAPNAHEIDHDFLWRHAVCLPERGRIGIFNRSHYEEVLVVRVHRELLEKQRLPAGLVTKSIWQERFQSIRDFERHLVRNGTVVLKFFLHVSKDEQRKRFLERIDDPEKRWKFSAGDVAERKLWDHYMDAYEDAIRETSRPGAPWYVVPADNQWFTRIVVAAALIEALEGLDLHFPEVDAAAIRELQRARRDLVAESSARRKRRSKR